LLNLATTSSLLQLVTGAGVNSIQVQASFTDLLAPTTVTPGQQDTVITAAATTTIVSSPAASTVRNVKFLSILNTSAMPCPVTVQHWNGSIAVSIFSITLLPGYTIQYNSDGDGFVVYNTLGQILVLAPSVILGGVAIEAGTQVATSGTAVFSNSNNVSFGMSDSSVVTAQAALNVSAGTTSQFLSNVVFSNANGASFGLAGSTLTASFSPGTISVFSQDADFVTHFPIAQAALSMQKVSLPMNISATAAAILAAVSGSSNSTDAVTIGMAVYTLSAGTASLATSASRLLSWTTGSATNVSSEYGGASGTRYRTIGLGASLTPGDYLFAWSFSTANGAAVSVFGRAGLNIVGTFDGVETSTFLNGTSIAPVGAFPMTIGATDTGYARTGFSAMYQPGVVLFGS
jgi:hypothetical protein